jgi:drug/metabolite transporter (DMT)-like permease
MPPDRACDNLTHSRFVVGVTLGVLCTFIWGGQAVVSRLSVFEGLSAADVTVLRFLAAGMAMIPIGYMLGERPFPVGKLGWRRGFVLALLAGAPYSLVLVGGAAFAPALHSAVVAQGLTPVVATGLGYLFSGQRPTDVQLTGLFTIIAGITLFSADSGIATQGSMSAWQGHVLFALAALMWATYGFLAKRWRADAINATATVCILSLVSVPIWLTILPTTLCSAPVRAMLLQMVYQGLLVGAASLLLYTHAVSLLGSVSAALFLPLVPIAAGFFGGVVLGEWPSGTELVGGVAVVCGMGLALRAGASTPPECKT